MPDQFVNILKPSDADPTEQLADIDWDRLRNEASGDLAGAPSAAKRITELIIAAIRNSCILPGSRLRETELAAALGASRTPLREALHGLKQQGILYSDADSGLRVRLLNWRDINEFYELRATLEGMSARLAARNASAVEREVIVQINTKEQELMKVDAPAQDLARLNHAFHQAILNGARNGFLQHSLNQQNQILILLGPTAYSLPGRRAEILKEHRAVCLAIEKRNELAAEQAMQAHLHKALSARLNLLCDQASAKDD